MSKCSENWNRWTRVNSQTAGREKIFRLLQYSCQLISSFDGYGPEKQSSSKLKQLETILSLTQKLMRFGRSAETLQSALNTISISDPTIRFTVTLSRISSSLYLFSDHVLWLSRVGLISANSQKWSNLSYRFWLYSILMNLIRDFYEIRSLMKHYALFTPRCLANKRISFEERLLSECTTFCNVLLSHQNVAVETMKNMCDFWIPLHYLGYFKLNSALLASLGITSSLASILQIVDFSYRLSPN